MWVDNRQDPGNRKVRERHDGTKSHEINALIDLRFVWFPASLCLVARRDAQVREAGLYRAENQ
jgi:hypothetical protein